MRRFRTYGLALLFSAVMVAPAFAGTIDFSTFPGGPGVDPKWQPITSVLDGSGNIIPGSTYWAPLTASGDGGFQHTIGNYMIGGDTGDNFGADPQPAFSASDVEYWGTATAGHPADTNIAFDSGGVFSAGTNLRLEVAGNAGINSFGYYLLSAPGTLIQLYAGSDGPNTLASFVPVGAFGFYLTGAAGTFRSDGTSQSGDADGNQHFAVFRDVAFPGAQDAVWIGVEDVPFGSADRDYQDFIVRVDVPEPATFLLVGSGLLALGVRLGVRGRRRS